MVLCSGICVFSTRKSGQILAWALVVVGASGCRRSQAGDPNTEQKALRILLRLAINGEQWCGDDSEDNDQGANVTRSCQLRHKCGQGGVYVSRSALGGEGGGGGGDGGT